MNGTLMTDPIYATSRAVHPSEVLANVTAAFKSMTDALDGVDWDATTRKLRRITDAFSDAVDRELATKFGLPGPSHLGGVQLHLAAYLPDGDLYVARVPAIAGFPETTAVLLGTGRTEKDDVIDEARLIVRRGMADVLAWLGESPEYLGRHGDILELVGASRRDIPVNPSP